jgi:hypothetical protein
MRTIRFALSALILALVGCQQRLSIEKTVSLEPSAIAAPALVDGPKSDQKIKVEFSSTDSPVNVFVILGKDENVILRELERATPKVDAVASKSGAKDGVLEATIPAGKDYGVYLNGAAKKTQVTVKVKSQ